MSEPEAKRQLIEQLTDRFINDPEFREQMSRDPEGTTERFGMRLDEKDRQVLRSIDWSSLPDEQLTERASKAMTSGTCSGTCAACYCG